MNKMTLWWILAAYSILSILGAFKSMGAGVVNLAAVSGVMIAMIFYTRRYVAEKRGLVVKGFLAISAVVTVISIVAALIASKGGMLGNIVSNVGGGICTIALVLLANAKKFEFIEQCDTKTFVIILLVAFLVLPSVMMMLSGLVTFILAIIIIIAFSGVLFSNLGDFMMANRSEVKVYRDAKGYNHATAYDAEQANESYKADSQE